MDALLQMIGSAGIPTSFVGVVLFLYITNMKHMATVKAEYLARNERLAKDLADKIKELTEEEATADALRQDKIALQLDIARLKTQLIELGGSNGNDSGTT